MTNGEPDAGLGQRDAGAHQEDGNQQGVALMVRGGVREPLLDRRAVDRLARIRAPLPAAVTTTVASFPTRSGLRRRNASSPAAAATAPPREKVK